jgi:hypothetical protein
MGDQKPSLFKPFAKTLMLTLAGKVLRGNTNGTDENAGIQGRVMRRVAETLESRAPVFHEEYEDQRRQAESDGLVGRIRNAVLDAVLDGARGEQAEVPPYASTKGKMSRAEALAIFDLQEGATRDEILKAHARLIKRVHPDVSGSTLFAKQTNQAREILLGKRGANA